MDENKIKELDAAISKLSEEDQEQIAGGAVDKSKLKDILERNPGILATAYGGPMVYGPAAIPIVKPIDVEKFEEMLEQRKKVAKAPQNITNDKESKE